MFIELRSSRAQSRDLLVLEKGTKELSRSFDNGRAAVEARVEWMMKIVCTVGKPAGNGAKGTHIT